MFSFSSFKIRLDVLVVMLYTIRLLFPVTYTTSSPSEESCKFTTFPFESSSIVSSPYEMIIFFNWLSLTIMSVWS